MYFITTLYKDENGELDPARCMGYYKDREYAIEVVENNVCDIREFIYEYVIVEHIPEGIFPYADPEERILFQWNDINKKFEKIDEPKDMEHVCNYSIG